MEHRPTNYYDSMSTKPVIYSWITFFEKVYLSEDNPVSNSFDDNFIVWIR